MSRWIVRFALLAMTAALAGCAGYRLGPTGGQSAGARSIAIQPFLNQTMEPRLGEPVTQALRKSVQKDGTYRLASQADADVIVTGAVVSFSRSELSYQPNDLATVRDYTMHLTAQIKAVERSSGKVLVEKFVSGRSNVRVGSDLASAERQAIPIMAEDLARKATSAIVDGTW